MAFNRSDLEQVKHKALPSRTWSLFLLVLSVVYFISPIDLLPDPIYIEDVVGLLAALAKVYWTFRSHRLARPAIQVEAPAS